jgi:DNA-binding MarR family transcriptional regulator
MSAEVHVFDRLLQIALLIQDDLARAFADSELTVARTHLLWELHSLGPSTQQTLAGALKVSPRNVTGLVDALEAGNFVAREPHPHDRRATLVTLTDRGLKTMTEMEQQRRQIAAELVADLDPTQLEALRQGLDSVAARLQAALHVAAAADQTEGRSA